MGLRKGDHLEEWDSVDAEALLKHVANNSTQAAVLRALQLGTVLISFSFRSG
jgi:hypothetical protein